MGKEKTAAELLEAFKDYAKKIAESRKTSAVSKEVLPTAKAIGSSLNKYEMDLLAQKLGSMEEAHNFLKTLGQEELPRFKQGLQKELKELSKVPQFQTPAKPPKMSNEELLSRIKEINEAKNPRMTQKANEAQAVSSKADELMRAGDENVFGDDFLSPMLPKSQVLPKQTQVPSPPKTPEMLSPLKEGELIDEATGMVVKPQELPSMLAAEKSRANLSPSKLDLSQFGSHLNDMKPGQLSMQDIVEAALKNKKVQVGAMGAGALGALSSDSVQDSIKGSGMGDSLQQRAELPKQEEPVRDVAAPEQTNNTEVESSTEQQKQVSQPESSILAHLLASKDEDYEKYKDALKRRDLAVLANQLGQAGVYIGAGISGAKPVGMELFKQNIDLAQQIPEDYKQNIAMDSYDPNSKISKNYREFLGRYMKDVPQNLTAAQIKETILPAIQKENVAKSNAEKMSRMDEFRQKRLDMTAVNKAKSQLEAAKSRALSTIGGAAGTVLRTRINAADAIFATAGVDNEEDVSEEGLQKMTGALNQLPPQMISELTMELNKLLTGAGIPAQSTFRKLNPKNLNMDIATFSNYVKSEMGPAKQAEYAKLVLKTASRVKKGAKKSLGDLVKKSFAGTEHIKKQLPEDYENVIRELELNPEDFGYKSESPKKEEPSKQSSSKYAPGQIVEVKGKRYKIGDDGDTLIPQ